MNINNDTMLTCILKFIRLSYIVIQTFMITDDQRLNLTLSWPLSQEYCKCVQSLKHGMSESD